jgi:hypothetical protein
MTSKTAEQTAVLIEEATEESGPAMLERLAQERFGLTWEAFFDAYQRGDFTGTEDARLAEELAFLSRFGG